MTAYLYACGFLAGLGAVLTILLLIANRFLAHYGPCAVNINEEEPFVIEGGCTLLEALYQQRMFIPAACGGQGTCGFCKVIVEEGGGPLLPTELPYISKEEIAAGTRLACRIKIKEDITLRVKPEYLNVQEFKAVVAEARTVTHDTREILLKLIEPDQIEFRSGQYVQVIVPSTGELTMRAYSISSPPSRKSEIELLVRLIPGGLGSTYLHNVQQGDEIVLTGPYGEFILDETDEIEIICVGGGCGLAPMRSIIRHVHEVAPNKRCRLFFGARTGADVMYNKEFEQLKKEMPNFEMHYALSEPQKNDAWDGETGFIHESVERHIGTEGKRQAFLCGPPLMIRATMEVLNAKGISKEEVFYDEF